LLPSAVHAEDPEITQTTKTSYILIKSHAYIGAVANNKTSAAAPGIRPDGSGLQPVSKLCIREIGGLAAGKRQKNQEDGVTKRSSHCKKVLGSS
jgi:hypothetical protein